jgi:hypothetical protein
MLDDEVVKGTIGTIKKFVNELAQNLKLKQFYPDDDFPF